jgi:hypothetical protein
LRKMGSAEAARLYQICTKQPSLVYRGSNHGGRTLALAPAQKDDFFRHHLPHRLCLLLAFRDRQPWFKERIGQGDGDLLRTSKDACRRPRISAPF